MSDLISRQALCEYALNQKDKSITPNDIMRFPSAQPVAKDTNVPINVNDCISRQDAINVIMDADVCVTWNGVISDDDAVDIAIRATKGSVIGSIAKLPSVQPERRPMLYRDRVMLAKNFEEWARENHVIDCPEAIICYLDIIGLIQPERKTGRWIDRNDNVATCSVCGKRWGLYRLLNYCPNCGERMDDGE